MRRKGIEPLPAAEELQPEAEKPSCASCQTGAAEPAPASPPDPAVGLPELTFDSPDPGPPPLPGAMLVGTQLFDDLPIGSPLVTREGTLVYKMAEDDVYGYGKNQVFNPVTGRIVHWMTLRPLWKPAYCVESNERLVGTAKIKAAGNDEEQLVWIVEKPTLGYRDLEIRVVGYGEAEALDCYAAVAMLTMYHESCQNCLNIRAFPDINAPKPEILRLNKARLDNRDAGKVDPAS